MGSLFRIFVSCNIYYMVSGYNILAIFPFPGKSHFSVFNPLLIELTKRGHNLTVYTPFPYDGPYTSIPIDYCLKKPKDEFIDRISKYSTFQYFNHIFKLMTTWEEISNCEPLLELANSTEKYDLLITEMWFQDWVLGYAYKFGIPHIGMTTAEICPWVTDRIALPNNPSHTRFNLGGEIPLSKTLNFLERLQNTYTYWLSLVLFKYYNYVLTEVNVRKLFGSSFPPLQDIASNISLILVNSHLSVNQIRPLLISTVEIGGINLKEPEDLPKDIEKFINESEHDVIYFSMGSVLYSETFSEEKKQSFLKAFSTIPNRVLWKWEGKPFPNQPPNLMTRKWLPQQSILAHPKVKLFISHGGQSSTSEAVYEAVPVLGIPIFPDQKGNIKSLMIHGMAEALQYREINEHVLVEKINKIMSNDSYLENAKRLSARYKDRPMSPLDTAVYWTEYVIRHKGAHHLKSAAINMSWYQYFLIDVIACITLALLITVSCLFFLCKLVKNIIYDLFLRKTNKVVVPNIKLKRQ